MLNKFLVAVQNSPCPLRVSNLRWLEGARGQVDCIVLFDGRDLYLTIRELFSAKLFRVRAREERGITPPVFRQKAWIVIVAALIAEGDE